MNGLLGHEVRSILVSFRRRPLVPFVATAMLALSIAANVAVFTVISRTLLRPLPYPSADRLLVIYPTFISPDHTEETIPAGSVEIVQLAARSSQFSAIEAAKPWSMTVRGSGDPESVIGGIATAGIFRLLGVRPILGRDFVREDDVPQARVAVITYGWWQRRFGKDPKAVGRTITIDGHPVEIIGVLPREFEIAVLDPQPELFMPAGFSRANMPNPNNRSFNMFGRLRDGVSAKQGEAELRRISAQIEKEYPQSNEHLSAQVKTLRDAAFGTRRHSLIVLWLAVALVHLLACVNAASLLSAQIADERGLTALRLVLGAGRRHIIRYRLIQALITTGAGAIAGVVLGSIALRVALLNSSDQSLTAPVKGAWILPLFLIAVSVVTAVIVAIVPALRETRTTLTSALNEQGNRSSSSVRGTLLRELFIIGEVALAVPLLLAAMTAVNHFRSLQRTELGFDPRNVSVSQIILPPRYDKTGRTRFARELIQRIEAIPGVSSAAITTCNFAPDSDVTTMGGSDRYPEPISMNFRRITPRYLETMRIPLLAGRTFNDSDRSDSPPVALISGSLGKRFFGDANPIGQRILRRPPNPPMTIVGVVADVRDAGASVDPKVTLYTPYLQNNFVYLTLVVRAKGDPAGVRQQVHRAVWSLDRDITPSRENALTTLMTQAVGTDRLQMLLLSGFGFVALILAVGGIYGMTSYGVAKRMREIGVRLAFGATPRDVIIEVVRRAIRAVAIGVVAGVTLTLLAQRIASIVVYGTVKFDPSSAAFIIAILFVTTLVAACIPSFRTRSIQPVMLLRDNT